MLRNSHIPTKPIKALLIGAILFVLSLTTTVQGANGCAEIFQRAMKTLHDSCANVGRNEACYGNQSITASLRNNALTFNDIGNRVDVAFIESLSASALDVTTGEWGLSLMKLKVNLPDTLPGANVTFLVHGGTSVENVSGDMQVFYFTSSLGEPQCKEMPSSSIVVHSPNHERVTFVANGVEINMGSTVVLSAQPNSKMNVYLVEGSVNVTAAGQTVTLQPNEYTEVQLGGTDGLQAVGVPNAPVTVQEEVSTGNLISTVGDLFGEDANTSSKGGSSASGGQGNLGGSTKPGASVGADKSDKADKSKKDKEKKEKKDKKKDDKGSSGSSGKGGGKGKG